MVSVSLKRLVAKKETQKILLQLGDAIATPFFIQDSSGTLLFGDEWELSVTPSLELDQHPILLGEEAIGRVWGEKPAQVVATVLSHLATKEWEQKQLAQETLDRYKEVTLLYNLAEKITATLELNAVAQLALEEAKKRITGDQGAVILWNPQQQDYERLVYFGDEFSPFLSLQPEGMILEWVIETGIGEIVNDVPKDNRLGKDVSVSLQSLVCAPLKSRDRVMGLLVLGTQTPFNYTAGDLKLLGAVAAQAASAIENALLHENKLREERIKSNLERYVPSQLVQALLNPQTDVSLAPARQEITILFSDIRNFTTQCEELQPETIVGYLNEYFTHMVEVIFDYDGTVNKFVGDMIVALFGAPFPMAQSEKQAIEAAIAMQQRIQKIPVDWIRRNFNTGIGISSGKVIVGNIGSPRHTDYTAIGDQVNTASRLQSLAQGGQILVSRNVYEATQDLFQFRELGSLKVKGKRHTVDVFEVLY